MTDQDLDDRARQILRDNDRGGYTIPTKGLYPFQWNWDSAFAAWGFSTFDIDRAWTELETLFSGQWDTGMVPHIIFHVEDDGYFPGSSVWSTGQTPPSSGISQPPVAATLARKIFETDPEAGRDRLSALYPKLLDWHRWWREARTVDGLACVTHPWESGRDNCPDWDPGMENVDGSGVGPYQRRDTGHVDASMRPSKEEYDRYLALVQYGVACGWDQGQILGKGPFVMADPAITFILIRANRDLAALAEVLGADSAEPLGWARDLETALPGIWNEDLQAYCARDMRTGAFARSISSGASLGLLAAVENPQMEDRLSAIWDRVEYGFPSNDPAAPSFDARRYWRGPTWPVVNSLIAMGLKDAGRGNEEMRLRRETARLIRDGGFYEYFDPTDGTPCGGNHFTWTAAIWLAWASPNARN
ncbi:hypothetical protein R5H30_04520 [Sulfitobacter sp. D35]|uniref:MGH1-like glycoside hydrolase domain-containing protein n=1 Tax=Sulfitobacter sp. D35 TaxID=3083252 RepID=UPI00296F493B|nr:hypothetical protein [Sulfitobacter sp. D35]MDW4497236.1 hypothetical protein [Sulfitobacter sp. D35]